MSLVKIYALLLVGAFLLALNVGTLSALMRSQDMRRAVRLLIIFIIVSSASLFFFFSYKTVFMLAVALIGIGFFLWFKSSSRVNPSR